MWMPKFKILILLLIWLPLNAVAESAVSESVPELSGKVLFEANCGACHSLELPKSQRLDQGTWQWVIDDMVDEFGADWITEAQQKLILEYLVENYGQKP